MMNKKQKYDKQVRKEKSRYNATFIDFVQNIITVRKLNINEFYKNKINENNEQYLETIKVNEIKRSCMNAVFTGLMNWYKELPNGFETTVGEKGIKLSAGQKQRLNLIRGILIDKELYFFDEPTSNLDALSEEKITNMIEKYLKDKTYVIVTHRPKLKELCNKHYSFDNHMMKEIITV